MGCGVFYRRRFMCRRFIRQRFGVSNMKKFLLCAMMFTASLAAGEVEECQRLAPKYNATTEVVLWDSTRVDLLNDEYAFEVDWSRKWAEAIGQSLYYAELTGKKPAVILLIKNKKAETRYIYRLQTVAAKYNIKVFLEQVEIDE